MESPIKLNKWLRNNISLSENGTIYLTDIAKKLKGKVTSRAIALAMKREFKGLLVKSVRNKEYWAKRTQLYMGVAWTQRSSNPICQTGTDPLEQSKSMNNDNNLIPEQLDATERHHPQPPTVNMANPTADHTYIKMVESDHENLKTVLKDVTTSDILNQFQISDKMKILIETQLNINKNNPKGQRWNHEIIRLCLTLYCRSPKNYEFLSKSGFLILPSSSQIRRYKNVVDQQAGISATVLEWMKNEAEIQNIPAEGYEGGLLLDEMSIQDDIQLKKVGDEYHLIGFVECCPETEYFDKLSGKSGLKLATHVLQLLFVGHSGFRFPVAHFPTPQTSPHELYLIIWKCIKMLSVYGFYISYISLDGAQTNRVLMKLFLPKGMKTSDTIKTMTFPNVFDSSLPKVSVIMDYSHMMKKIRNNISKSGNMEKHTKLLKFCGKYIIWDHWFKAYQWDISSNNLKVHQKLTQDHFFLNSQLKMRNKLAEDVLDENMLHLMEVYKDTLSSTRADELESSIELLKNTSKLVRIFRDGRPIRHYADPRLIEIRNVLQWFRQWEEQVNEINISNKDKEKCLISSQTREDIVSCLLGFNEMCKDRFKRSFGSIVASRVNSDPIENIFSQQRGIHNGANTNPDYLTYCRSTNAIILGQTPISRKSNACGSAGAHSLSLQTRRKPLQTININK